MKTFLLIVFGVVATLGQKSRTLEDFTNGGSEFAAEIYKEMLKLYPGNFLICPLSVRVILALAHAGAGRNTAKQLADGLHLPNDKRKIKEIALKLAPYLQVNDKYILTSANKIYLADRFKLSDQFKSTAVNVFSADAQIIDFTNNQQAALEMNRWVQEKTFDKIKDLVRSEYLTSDTVAVLINAMYFKANWYTQFDPDLTEKRSFFVKSDHKVEVDMMKMRNIYNYFHHKSLDAQFLELPYEGDDVTMNIVLPNRKDGLPELEAHLSDVLAHSSYYPSDVDVEIPKFKIETTIEFKKLLKTLGIVDAFDQKSADFSEMSADQRNVYISEVTQKTFIEVTEQGTTAGAATGVYMDERSFPHIFNADHPFIFFLKHKTAGIFFLGKLAVPEASENNVTPETFTVQPTDSGNFYSTIDDHRRIWVQ